MIQAQEYLDQNYPKNIRPNITDLSISYQELSGELDLSDFVNLEYLDCGNNQLTSLNISNCNNLKYLDCNDNKLTNLIYSFLPQLEVLSCSNNYLSSLDYSVLNSDKLFFLNVNSNNLQPQDLSVLSHLVNLKHLYIGNNDQVRIDQDIINYWSGSLESLRGLNKLRTLNIGNTDISSGIEYLPVSLKEIGCSTKERPTSLVTAIVEQLNNSQSFCYDEKADSYVSTQPESTYPVQAWLDQYYPEQERKHVKYLDISYEKLTGSLRLERFSNLRDFACFGNNLTSLEIDASGSQLESINCSDNQLTELNLSNCEQLKVLNCHNNRLSKLDITCCPKLINLKCKSNQITELNLTTSNQLTELWCQQNQLTQLLLPKQSNLKKLVVWDNLLTDLDWSALDGDKLTVLGLANNNFSEQDLSVFSRFTQLEWLFLGNHDQDKIDQGIYNKFQGSLEHLQNLIKLQKLGISNTDVNQGVEHLPTNLKNITYFSAIRPDSKVQEIFQQLDLFTQGKLWQEWEQLSFIPKEAQDEKKLSISSIPSLFTGFRELLPPELDETNSISWNTSSGQETINTSSSYAVNFENYHYYPLETDPIIKPPESKIYYSLEPQNLDHDSNNQITQLQSQIATYQLQIKRQTELIKKLEQENTHTYQESKKRYREDQLLSTLLQAKKQELEEDLTQEKKELKNKLGKDLNFLLESLLNMQVDIVKLAENDSPLQDNLQHLKDSLSKKIGESELEIICQKQKQITKISELIESLEEQQAQIENFPTKMLKQE